MTVISKRQRERLYIYKEQKIAKRFYTKIQTLLQNAGQFLLRFYLQKARHFTLRHVS